MEFVTGIRRRWRGGGGKVGVVVGEITVVTVEGFVIVWNGTKVL